MIAPPEDALATPVNEGAPLLDVRGLCVDYPLPGGQVLQAVREVNLVVHRGQSIGLVGESGSGKSTTGRALLQLIRPSAGAVLFEGRDLVSLWQRRFGRWQWGRELVALRRDIQMIFQDPYASLNPRMSVAQIVGEPLEIHKLARGALRTARIEALLEQVGLDARAMHRLPHAFSGGQRQRIGIARALATSPKLIVADEPTSALDVSIQAQILNLLQDLKASLNLTLVFIAHDLSSVRYLCEQVCVMFDGRIVEQASTTALFQTPKHPYTQALLAAAPTGAPLAQHLNGPAERIAPGARPQMGPSHCAYAGRCPQQMTRCLTEAPALRRVDPSSAVACHLYEAGTSPAGAPV